MQGRRARGGDGVPSVRESLLAAELPDFANEAAVLDAKDNNEGPSNKQAHPRAHPHQAGRQASDPFYEAGHLKLDIYSTSCPGSYSTRALPNTNHIALSAGGPQLPV